MHFLYLKGTVDPFLEALWKNWTIKINLVGEIDGENKITTLFDL